MCDSADIGEDHALGELTRQRHHLVPQRRDIDRRQRAIAGFGAVLLDGACVAQRLARRHAHPDVGRPVRDADAEAKASARDLVHHRRTLGEIDDGALVDRRDRRAEGDRFGVPGQRLAVDMPPVGLGT
jgi:hypothetical protein